MSTYPSAPPVNRKFLTGEIDDISTAGQIFIMPGFRCKVKKIWSVLNGAITTGDAVLTSKIGGTAITGGAITVANASSAAGDVDTASPTAANIVPVDTPIEIETDGGSTNAVKAFITIEVEPI